MAWKWEKSRWKVGLVGRWPPKQVGDVRLSPQNRWEMGGCPHKTGGRLVKTLPLTPPSIVLLVLTDSWTSFVTRWLGRLFYVLNCIVSVEFF